MADDERGEVAERLAPIAQQLIGRVHDDDPEANLRWLRSVVQPHDYEALLFLLAAAVPTDKTYWELVAWYTGEDRVERRRAQWREAKRRAAERLRPQAVDGSCGHTPGSDSAGEAA